MRILTLHKRSIHHPNFSEDFLFTHQLTDDILVCAVMDGCSTAKDSHFTSALYSKSLDKSCRMLPQMKEIIEDFDLDFMELREIGDFIMKQLFDDLKKTKKLFFLNIEELLSTISLLVYNKNNKTACIKMSGDGLFAVNGKVTEIDQNNIPNFLGYHLNKKFENIGPSEIESWTFDDVHDISISTDGIDKLRKKISNSKETSKVRRSLLIQKPTDSDKMFLENEYNQFTKKGFTPYDDLSLIRIINYK